LVTCGNAVLQITQQPPQSAPNPWTKTEDLKVWTDPPVKKAPESSSSSSPKPKTLDDRTEQTWQISLKNAEERLAKALKALQALKAETWAAELAFRNDPTSRDLMIDAEMRAKALVKPQHAFDLVQIEMDAKKAAYACLLLERHPVNGRGKADDDHQVLLRLARAESDLKQATFEGLRLTREKEAMRAHDPLLPLIQPQLDQLKVIQAAHANEVEALQKQKEALGVLKVTDPKVAEIERRRQELLMFEKANAEKGISPFLRWSGGAKPT
jgi:hypothetical protein